MKTILVLIAGIGIGIAVSGFTADGKARATYFIAESVVTNPEQDAKIIARLPVTAERFGGRYLARGGKIVAFGDEAPKRVVIVAFDSMEAVRAWRDAPDVKELEELRKKAGTSLRLYAVEGL
jgi:uncharacterized protein (DUF1330 family)